MKLYHFLPLLLLLGCATKTTRVTQYCDENWQGRFDSRQDCYDRKMGEVSPLSAGLKGFSDGFNKSRQQQQSTQSPTSCTTNGGSGFYTTNCN